MAITIRKPDEIANLKRAGKIVGKTLNYLQDLIKLGMTLKEIDALGEAFVHEQGVIPSFKGLYKFTTTLSFYDVEWVFRGDYLNQ